MMEFVLIWTIVMIYIVGDGFNRPSFVDFLFKFFLRLILLLDEMWENIDLLIIYVI